MDLYVPLICLHSVHRENFVAFVAYRFLILIAPLYLQSVGLVPIVDVFALGGI